MKKRITLTIILLLTTVALPAQWSVLTTGTYSNLTLEDIHVSLTGDTIIAVGTDLLDNFTGHTLFSYDGGNTWDTTRYNSGYLFKGIAFSDNNTGVIAALGGVGCAMRTVNGGANWLWNWCDTTYKGVYDITFVNNNTGYMVGYGKNQFDDGNVYRTNDAGQSWTSISGAIANKPFEFIEAADQNVLYGGSFLFFNELLYRSVDGGGTWDSLDVTGTGCRDAYFFDAATGILLGRDGIYRTTDSANTWTKVGNFPTINQAIFSSVDFVSPTHGFALAYDGSNNGHFLHTTDGGLSWQRQNYTVSNGTFVKVRAFGNKAYAVTSRGTVLVSPGVGIGLDEAVERSISIAPNPFYNSTTVRYNNTSTVLSSNVYDLYGKQVAVHVQKHSNSLVLDFDNSAAGVYTLVLEFEDGSVLKEKLVIANH